jgi:hypothetical protein
MAILDIFRRYREAVNSISDKEVIALAAAADGKISPTSLCAQTDLSFNQAKIKLTAMHWKGVFNAKYDYTEGYSVMYVLKNRDLLRQQFSSPPPPRSVAPHALSDAVAITTAVRLKGKITPALLCVRANVPVEDARRKLEELQRKGVFDIQATEDGTIVYLLNDLSAFEELGLDAAD